MYKNDFPNKLRSTTRAVDIILMHAILIINNY